VLDHFFHDEWISYQKPHAVRHLGTSFAAQNRAQVEFGEKHKTRAAEPAVHNAFQFQEGICRPRRLKKFDYVGLADSRLERGHDSIEWL
jgi:hypothetical protein